MRALLARAAPALALYAASRIVTTGILVVFALVAPSWDCGVHCAPPTPLRFFSGGWDATYYREIATAGYPSTLPTDAAGAVLPNAWAFLPLYPWVVRAVMIVGVPFEAAAIAVSVVAGAVAAVALHALVRADAGERGAFWAVALFCFGPVSFVLQAGYAESLFLALLFGALVALRRGRLAAGTALAVAAAFTRPGVVALALALAVVLVLRWRAERRRMAHAAAIVVIGAAGLAWPAVAWAATGIPDAYTRTELSWWTGYVGSSVFAPLTPWFVFAGRYLGWAGWLLVVALAAAFAWWVAGYRRRVRRGGGDGALVAAWAGSYALYLLAVFLPQQSLLRIALPLAPLLGDPAFTRRGWGLPAALVVVGVALQPVAIAFLWILGYP